MDSLIAAAARALAAGDTLGALKRISLRKDPPAIALRGIAMAQLGEYPRARELLRRAIRAFGEREELARERSAGVEPARDVLELFVELRIPRDQLVVITGPSGSGKSSLAFDTIYAEGQRRYVESLSAYARQFLDQLPKPAVASIDGVGQVTVNLTFDPPWDQSRMSDEARLALNMF